MQQTPNRQPTKRSSVRDSLVSSSNHERHSEAVTVSEPCAATTSRVDGHDRDGRPRPPFCTTVSGGRCCPERDIFFVRRLRFATTLRQRARSAKRHWRPSSTGRLGRECPQVVRVKYETALRRSDSDCCAQEVKAKALRRKSEEEGGHTCDCEQKRPRMGGLWTLISERRAWAVATSGAHWRLPKRLQIQSSRAMTETSAATAAAADSRRMR